uniref:Cation-transporting P-type ATPase C-terminal domain-containing protein n=1 Tax=Dendroctonus ponderosae TaxID=77166 RepID=A0AAR5PDG0_DENPD
TGTLTHDGLIMNSVLPCVGAKFFEPVSNISGLNVQSKFVQGMATCHSLTTIDGKMNGDPSSYQIGIIREFSFSSTAQCMSVICKDLKKPNMFAFTKGAPEKLYNFCIPETIPTDFQNRLSFYTTRGFRVIALAYKELPVKFKWTDAQAAERDMIEHDLEFLGLLILQNPLKSETVPVLRQFRNANIRTVMITGDNIRTAISVARDCEMVDSTATIYILNVTEVNNINEKPNIVMEKADSGVQPDFTAIHIYDTNSYFAIDGKTWTNLKLYYEDLIPSLLVRTTVFARFQPDQKTQLVTSFQDLDYIVSMVGDGANDCGVSICINFFKFIYTNVAISCIIWLILEGRCSLVTSFSIFKYMALYSMIQFVTILIIYTCHSMLGNFQFLFIDLIITTTLAVTMGRQGYKMLQTTLQIFAIAAFQVGALYYLYQQDWFQPIPSDVSDEIILSWENTVLFTVSCFQYVILAWHFTKGKPYRMNVFTNFWFLLNVLCLMVIVTWMALYPCKRIAEIMELIDFAEGGFHHKNFRCLLLLFPIGQFIVAGAIETFMHERTWLKRLFQCIFCKKQPKNKYKRLLQNQNFEDYLASLRELSNSLR